MSEKVKKSASLPPPGGVHPAFDRSLRRLLGVEKGYSDHPSDRGGKTRFGITERVARQWGYEGSMQRLPASLAQTIYYWDYWAASDLDDVAELVPEMAWEIFEAGVNAGARTSGRWFQQCLNGLNRQERDYADIVEDGVVGPVTVQAYSQYLRRRGAEGARVLIRLYNALQGAHYARLARRDPEQEDFLYGWAKERL